MSAELAARRTAAAAVLADYLAAAATADVADRAVWAARMAEMLGYLLAALNGDETSAPLSSAFAQLEEIRIVLEAFDWETDDRQYALEQIDQIVTGGGDQ